MATIVELGRRNSFPVGLLQVRPSRCEVVGPAGREQLEPRVMKVLVALAEAAGETVTRDDLVRLCWDGRIVGDDSINRVILKLRQLAKGSAKDSFSIETIKKVGYRLLIDQDAGQGASILDFPQQNAGLDHAGIILKGWLRRWPLIAAAAVLLLVTIGVLAARRFRDSADASDPVALDLATRGRAAVFEGTPSQLAQGIGYFRQALARTPDDADLWGSLAMAMVLNQVFLTPEEQRFGEQRIRQAARRSIALAAGEGHAWGALTNLVPTYRNWDQKARAIKEGLSRADRNAPALLRQRELFDQATGHEANGFEHIRHLAKVHSLVPFIRADYLALLRANGRLEEAENTGSDAARLWPGDFRIWRERFYLAALGGNAEQAEILAGDATRWPRLARAEDMARYRLLATALRSGTAVDADKVLDAYRSSASEGQLYLEDGIMAAAALQRPDVAFALADQLYGAGATPVRVRFADHVEYEVTGDRATAFWFSPPLDRLWGDPRFLGVMQRVGLLDYWRAHEAPDLCRAEPAWTRCLAAGLKLSPPGTD